MNNIEFTTPITLKDPGAAGIESLLDGAWQMVTSCVEDARHLIQDAKARAEAEGNERCLDECLLLEARYDGEMDRYYDALQKARTAYHNFCSREDIEGQIRACRVFGYLYSRHGKYNNALEYLFMALKMVREYSAQIREGQFPIQVFLLNNIAVIYAETERCHEALSFFYQAYELVRTGRGSMIATILTNIAEMHLNTGDAKMALRYNKLAMNEIKRQKLGFHDLHNCWNSFGLIYQKTGQYDTALESYRKSLDAAIKGESKYNQVVTSLALARLHMEMHDAASALQDVALSFKLADEIHANVLLRDICLVMAQASESLGDLVGALACYKRHMELNCEISTREVEQRLSNYTAEFKVEQAKMDAEIFRLKNIELKQKSIELEESNRKITFISEIGQEITATLDLEKVLNIVYDSIGRIMDVNVFAVGLYEEENKRVVFRKIVENCVSLTQCDIPVDCDGYVVRCIREREEIVIDDLEAMGSDSMLEKRMVTNGILPRTLIFHPLILAGSIIGVMTVQSYKPNAYSQNNIEMIRALGTYIAVALNNSQKSEELRQKAEELELLSKTDPLTGIYNRRYIIEKMEEERTRFRRYGKKFCLIIVDIDFFKKVNDICGHDCGDHVLAEVSGLLKRLLREQDCLARWGGEEFLVLLPETDAAGALTLAERLRMAVSEKVFEYRKHKIAITLTLGICQYGENISIDDAIRKADNALYEGKHRGRNCVVISD